MLNNGNKYSKKILIAIVCVCAICCFLVIYLNLRNSYENNRIRADYIAQSYGTRVKDELYYFYEKIETLKVLLEADLLSSQGERIFLDGINKSDKFLAGEDRLNRISKAINQNSLITNISIAIAGGTVKEGVPQSSVVVYCFPYERNKAILGQDLLQIAGRESNIQKVYQNKGKLVIEGPFNSKQNNELVLVGREAVMNPEGTPWGFVAIALDLNSENPNYFLKKINLQAIEKQGYLYHLYKLENNKKLTIASSNTQARLINNGEKFNISLADTVYILEVTRVGGWLDKKEIIGNLIIAFLFLTLLIFGIQKWFERQWVIQELALEKERYDLVIHESKEIIFDVDVLQKKILWSPLYYKIFGFNPFTDLWELTICDKSKYEEEPYCINARRLRKIFDEVITSKESQSKLLILVTLDQKKHWFRCYANCIVKNDIVVRMVGKLENVDLEMNEKAALQGLSRLDPLTGIYNKLGFREAVEQLLESGEQGSFIFADLDNFKAINDTLGHLAGDEVLKIVAEKIKAFFRPGDVIGRFGGDEFYIYAPNLQRETTMLRVAGLCESLKEAIEKENNKKLNVSISAGICFFPQDGQDFETLLEHADKAVYEAKRQGKNTYAVYHAE